jgi:uncharacterized membrane protein (DUF4010 family)
MDLSALFVSLGIALGLGLLVGLEREKSASEIAGVRTIPLITVWGTLAGWLSLRFGALPLAASILALASLVVVANVHLLRKGELDSGLTSEMAILVMFGVGALLAFGPREIAIAIGGGVAVLLHAKEWLHGISSRLDRRDLTAIMRFALIALVILPILPDRPFGPFHVLNLREIWLMVVLIVGISLGGYIVWRFFGARAGIILGGLLGGVISSTATTVGYARRSRSANERARLFAVAVMIANAVVMIRVLLEIWLVGRPLFAVAAWPIAILFVVQVGIAGLLARRVLDEDAASPEQENPAELKTALVFAALYAVVLLAVAATTEYFGKRGLYAVSVISGFTDVDAITLSISRLAARGSLDLSTSWRLVVVATMSNLLFKTAIVGALGTRKMFGVVALASAVAIAAGGILLLAWPA